MRMRIIFLTIALLTGIVVGGTGVMYLDHRAVVRQCVAPLVRMEQKGIMIYALDPKDPDSLTPIEPIQLAVYMCP